MRLPLRLGFSAQVLESLKGLGQEYRRQVVPAVVHAHLEELLLRKLLGTGKKVASSMPQKERGNPRRVKTLIWQVSQAWRRKSFQPVIEKPLLQVR